jgi:hypothetical protein
MAATHAHHRLHAGSRLARFTAFACAVSLDCRGRLLVESLIAIVEGLARW